MSDSRTKRQNSAPEQPPEQQPRRTEMRVRPTGPIVPSTNVSGHALMCVIAIMSFLACLTLGGVSMVRATAQSWQSQISREITVQIKPDDSLDMEKALADARDLALTFSGTTDGKIVDRAATARLLEPWLGEGLDLDELPVPRLIIITIDENNPPDFAAMRKALTETIPQAFLDDHRTWVDRLVAMANTTAMIGTGVLALVFSAMVLTVIFATRGALSGNRHIVEVLHFVGAEAGFVRRVWQLRRKADPDRRTRRPFAEDPDLRRDDNVFDVGGGIAGEVEPFRERGGAPIGHGQPVVQAAVELQLRDRAQADADADERRAQQVARQARGGKQDVAPVVDTPFEQHATGTNRFGIFGHERPLLRKGGSSGDQQDHQSR